MMRSIAIGPRGLVKEIGRPAFWIAILALMMGCPALHAQQSAPTAPLPAETAQQQAAAPQQPRPAPAPANIGFVDGAPVTLSPDAGGRLKLDTAVKNSGGTVGTPSYALFGSGDECKPETEGGTTKLNPGTITKIEPNEIQIITFTITGVALPAVCYVEIQSQVTKLDAATSKTVTSNVVTSMKQVKLSQYYMTYDVLLAVGVCFVFSALLVLGVYGFKSRWPARFGMPAWEFAKSWSATLTLAGATVTAALALGALPELTKNASKGGYAILALFIATVVVFAPFVFVVFRWGSIAKDEQTKKQSVVYAGGVAPFLWYCALTLFAGLAQLLVLFLVGDEIFRGYGFWSSFFWWPSFFHNPPWAIGFGPMLIVVLAIALCVYTVLSMLLTVKLQLAEESDAADKNISPDAAAAAAAKRQAEFVDAYDQVMRAMDEFSVAAERADVAKNADDAAAGKAAIGELRAAELRADTALAVAEAAAAKSIAAHKSMLGRKARTVLKSMTGDAKAAGGQVVSVDGSPVRSWPML